MQNSLLINTLVRKILEYLKQCPTKTWLVMDDFKKWLRIQEYRFLRDELTSALVKDKYYNDYYEASFEQLETRFLDRMFIEYLATLGIVDVACLIDIDDYDEEFVFVKLFKITELGSILLGLEEEKEEPIEDDIKINEDFTITLKEGMLQHELYFERFLDKSRNGLENKGYCILSYDLLQNSSRKCENAIRKMGERL